MHAERLRLREGGVRPMSQSRGGDRPERGAVVVEFALVFPLVIMLIVGMVTAGLAYNQQLQITHAAREGARFAATVSPTQTFANGDTWAANVRDLVVERSAGELVDAQVCVSLVEGNPGTVYEGLPGYSTAGAGTPCIANQPYPLAGTDDGLRAQVTVARPGRIELVIFDDVSFTMTSDATAKSEATG